jgi:hypothetical protein
MNRIPLSLPELGIIAGTRGMLGAGVGMLIATHLNRDQRRAVGWTLVAVGALTTIPIAAQLFKSRNEYRDERDNGARSREMREEESHA